MKSRLLPSILLLAMIITPMIVPVLARFHTLEWGVDPGEEFTYVLQREHYSDPYHSLFAESLFPFLAEMQPGQKALLEVNNLDTIQPLINESSQLPRSYCNLTRSNDSALIMTDLTSFVVPIGDWDLIDEVENITGTEGLTLIDTEDEWGTIGEGYFSGTEGSEVIAYIEMRYEKENGTLTYLRHKYTAVGIDLIDIIFVQWHPGMPTIVGGGIPTATLLIIAISGVTGVVIAFIVYRVIRGKKTAIQRLGE